MAAPSNRCLPIHFQECIMRRRKVIYIHLLRLLIALMNIFLFMNRNDRFLESTSRGVGRPRNQKAVSVVLRRQNGIRSQDQNEVERNDQEDSRGTGTLSFLCCCFADDDIFICQGAAALLSAYGGYLDAVLTATLTDLFQKETRSTYP